MNDNTLNTSDYQPLPNNSHDEEWTSVIDGWVFRRIAGGLMMAIGAAMVLFSVVAFCLGQPVPDAAPKAEEVVVTEMPELGSYWPCRIVRCVDGDTVDVEVKKIYRIRLEKCWAPEVRGIQKEAGLRAKFYMEKIAKDKSAVVVIPWHNEAKDELTLNRFVGRVIVNGTDLGAEMVRKKLAAATKEMEEEMFPTAK